MFKKIFSFILIAAFTLSVVTCLAQSGINKSAYYSAMSSSKAALMDAQLSALKSASGTDKEAFEGAMLMRKAGILTIPAKKLAMFKEGCRKLETAISKNPQNVEYRFLRLIVQENAPRSLGYHKAISQDSKFIRENFRNLPAMTQNSIAGYSKKSKALAGAF